MQTKVMLRNIEPISPPSYTLSSAQKMIDEARNGRIVILVDGDDDRRKGSLVVPAQMATAAAINFMAQHGRGIISLALTHRRIEELRLPAMVQHGHSAGSASITSIEARTGVTTGISAGDRARTIATAIYSADGPKDLVTPGHIFPLRASEGGVLAQAGHTEAAVDLARLAGLNPSGVLCGVLNDQGGMSNITDLTTLAQRQGLKIGSIRDLVAYRVRHDRLIRFKEEIDVAGKYGDGWVVKIYASTIDLSETLVLQKGYPGSWHSVMLRLHDPSILADLLDEVRLAKSALHRTMAAINVHGAGIIVLKMGSASFGYSRNAVHQIDRRDRAKDFAVLAQIAIDLGVRNAVLLANCDDDMRALQSYGIESVSKRVF